MCALRLFLVPLCLITKSWWVLALFLLEFLVWLTKACDLRPDFVLGGVSELFSPFSCVWRFVL